MGGQARAEARRVRDLEDETFHSYPRYAVTVASVRPRSPRPFANGGASSCCAEFQFLPLPNTNPVLVGYRWKEYHEALGLKSIVDSSWATVLKEKPGMIHLLDFPYNGETPRTELISGKVTDNKWHL